MDFTIYLDKENIYSINKLIEFINKKKIKAKKFPLSKFDADLNYKAYRPKNKKKYSILDVINHPKKYEYDYKRMMDSKLYLGEFRLTEITHINPSKIYSKGTRNQTLLGRSCLQY